MVEVANGVSYRPQRSMEMYGLQGSRMTDCVVTSVSNANWNGGKVLSSVSMLYVQLRHGALGVEKC